MPRLSYLGALLAIAALLSAPVFSQTSGQTSGQKPAPNTAPNGARIEHVVVRGTDAAMEVEIQTSGAPVAPDTQAITGPDRIVVDFPGALPAAELRALTVNRGVLKAIRKGLFFDNPPITRIVLDLAEPQSYRISTTQNAVVIKLGPASLDHSSLDHSKLDQAKLYQAKLDQAKLAPAKPARVTPVESKASEKPVAPAARLQNAVLTEGSVVISRTPVAVTNVAQARVAAVVANAVPNTMAPVLPAVSEAPPPPPQPLVLVSFQNGMLRIRADKATLAQVLFEVQRQTQADIAIPAGAEQEQVAVDLGPAPARDVLGALLNGSKYNFVFVGNELSLERVILTRRDPNIF